MNPHDPAEPAPAIGWRPSRSLIRACISNKDQCTHVRTESRGCMQRSISAVLVKVEGVRAISRPDRRRVQKVGVSLHHIMNTTRRLSRLRVLSSLNLVCTASREGFGIGKAFLVLQFSKLVKLSCLYQAPPDQTKCTPSKCLDSSGSNSIRLPDI